MARRGSSTDPVTAITRFFLGAIFTVVVVALGLAMLTGDIDVGPIVNPIMTQAVEAVQNIEWPHININIDATPSGG